MVIGYEDGYYKVYRPRFRVAHLAKAGSETTLCGLSANGHGLFLGLAPEEANRAAKLPLCRKCTKIADENNDDLH